jgi:HAMP domain-containing protein
MNVLELGRLELGRRERLRVIVSVRDNIAAGMAQATNDEVEQLARRRFE